MIDRITYEIVLMVSDLILSVVWSPIQSPRHKPHHQQNYLDHHPEEASQHVDEKGLKFELAVM